MEIRDVVRAWRADDITVAELMRAFVLHESWDVPVPPAAVAEYERSGTLSDIVVNELDGRRRLFLFSDASSPRDEWIDGVASRFITVPGQWVFQLDLQEVDEMVIDPGAEHSIALDAEQMQQIAERAWASVIEDVLDELANGDVEPGEERDDMLSLVADYPYFELAVYEDGDDARLVAAPDDQGRDLIAVFTHADAFDAFAEETNDEELRSVTLSGVELCEQLRELGVDGVMFDCSGPGPASAFERAFAEDVLRTA
jgi:hypothetical protein